MKTKTLILSLMMGRVTAVVLLKEDQIGKIKFLVQNFTTRWRSHTGDFFEEWNNFTPQIHISIFEELTG